MSKIYDVVATTGTYQKDGEKKYISRNVGAVIETKHGPRLILEKSFNPAGCPGGTDDGKIFLALFEPRSDSGGGQSQGGGFSGPPADDFDDDIPDF